MWKDCFAFERFTEFYRILEMGTAIQNHCSITHGKSPSHKKSINPLYLNLI